MKLKALLAGVMIVTANAAHANIAIHFPGLQTEEICSRLAGSWQGQGTVRSGFVECHYTGTANVVSTGAETYSMDVDLHKDSGICPDKRLQLPATCDKGAIHIQSDDADLSGSVNEQGTEANLSGTVNFTIWGSRVTADVENMHLIKKS